MSRIQHSWRRSRSLGNGVLHFHLLFLLFFLCLPFSLLPSPPHILFHLIKWPLTEKGICTQAAEQCTEPALHSTAQRGVMTSYDPFRGRHNCWSLLMQMKQHVDNRIQNEEKKSRESIIITVCAVCVCVCLRWLSDWRRLQLRNHARTCARNKHYNVQYRESYF